MLTRKLKYYLHLQYPVRIVVGAEGLLGSLPDLPGCSVVAESAPAVYAALDDARRTWLRDHIVAGDEIPLPNSYLAPQESEASDRSAPQSYAQEATPL